MLNSVAKLSIPQATDHFGRLSGSGAISARDFNTLLAAQPSDAQPTAGNAFLSKIQAAASPEEKQALIHGFASGYAAAFGRPDSPAPSQPASTGERPTEAQPTNPAPAPVSAPASTDSPPSASAEMEGYAALADQIVASGLPPQVKSRMLNDIAEAMAKLRDQNPPPVGDENAGSDKGANESKIVDTESATGDATGMETDSAGA